MRDRFIGKLNLFVGIKSFVRLSINEMRTGKVARQDARLTGSNLKNLYQVTTSIVKYSYS